MTVSQAITQDRGAGQSRAVPPSPIVDAANKVVADNGRALFDLLRQKWKEVPAGLYDRADTVKVLNLPDWELRNFWEGVWYETSAGPGYATRGWYQEMYRAMFRGKRVLEIGSGCGVDGVEFIRQGATWYFADIVPSNLKLIRRILDAFGLDCEGMTYIEDFSSLDQIPGGFDFIYCNGSMINVPFDFARRETLHLVSHLRPGGRWVELCYPRERWAREGRLPFAEWGRVTDGDATPWVEWYDLERLRDRFAPVSVNPLLAFNYYNDDYNWFDFRVDAVPDRRQVATYLASAEPKRLPIGLSPSAFKRHGATKVDVLNTTAGPALRVQTAPQIWSYAIQGTLSAATLRLALADATGDVVPAVELTLSVQQGRVGVGLTSDDLANFIGLERHFTPRDEPYRIVVPCPPGHERYHLILRNTQSGEASVFTVHQMALTSHRSEEPFDAKDGDGGTAPVVALTSLVRRHLPAITSENIVAPGNAGAPEVPVFVRAVAIDELDRALGYDEASRLIEVNRGKYLRTWTPEANDAPILAYLHRNHRPKRHLAIGTANDACQIAGAETTCVNSQAWDGNTLAPGSFDSVLLHGSQHAETMIRDTNRVLPLLRAGGMMIWRDFCPIDGPMADLPATRGTVYGIHQSWRQWSGQFKEIFWIRPSYLLVGIKS